VSQLVGMGLGGMNVFAASLRMLPPWQVSLNSFFGVLCSELVVLCFHRKIFTFPSDINKMFKNKHL
jgi:hypothetical protein